jgi:hypothetical protein
MSDKGSEFDWVPATGTWWHDPKEWHPNHLHQAIISAALAGLKRRASKRA